MEVALQKILASNPYSKFTLPSGAKRVVTFLLRPPSVRVPLPIEQDGARILCATAAEIFSVYVPGRRGPIFMTLIEKNFGQEVTTRTWETLKKVAAASGGRESS